MYPIPTTQYLRLALLALGAAFIVSMLPASTAWALAGEGEATTLWMTVLPTDDDEEIEEPPPSSGGYQLAMNEEEEEEAEEPPPTSGGYQRA